MKYRIMIDGRPAVRVGSRAMANEFVVAMADGIARRGAIMPKLAIERIDPAEGPEPRGFRPVNLTNINKS